MQNLTTGYKCAIGTYNNLYNSKDATYCKPCNAGKYCAAATMDQNCATCSCPLGYYCTEGTQSPVKCPDGTYTSQTGAATLEHCLKCPEGHYCISGTTTITPCIVGTFRSTVGARSANDCEICTSGYVCSKTGLAVPNELCPQGHYCPAGSTTLYKYPCPIGTINDSFGLSSSSQCESCPEGYVCDKGTGGATRPSACLAGSYCPYGTSDATKTLCKSGTWSDRTNISSMDECYPCPRGSWCPIGSTNANNKCPKGYCCTFGTKAAYDYPCPAGTYSDVESLESCDSCKACPQGHYCEEASTTPTKCPIKTYNLLKNSNNLSACLQCLSGYYCDTIGKVNPTICPIGKYSKEGQSSCSACEEGRFCDKTGTTFDIMENTNVCPPGLYCPVGMDKVPDASINACIVGNYCPKALISRNPIKCPIGTYNDKTGLSSVNDCKACIAGKCCATLGMTSAIVECPIGNYCLEGTGLCDTYKCPIGSYRSTKGAKSLQDCQPCPVGKFCDIMGTSVPNVCIKGHFCPLNSNIPQPCPLGTFSSNTGLGTSDDCTVCTGGKYCAGVGLLVPTGSTDAGFVGISGVFTSAPYDGVTGKLCPLGYYCPIGSAVPKACDAGKYVPSEGGKNKLQCISAPP
ncbi:hypothetical protein A3Q56_07913, partial [Intoshia linei]